MQAVARAATRAGRPMGTPFHRHLPRRGARDAGFHVESRAGRPQPDRRRPVVRASRRAQSDAPAPASARRRRPRPGPVGYSPHSSHSSSPGSSSADPAATSSRIRWPSSATGPSWSGPENGSAPRSRPRPAPPARRTAPRDQTRGRAVHRPPQFVLVPAHALCNCRNGQGLRTVLRECWA